VSSSASHVAEKGGAVMAVKCQRNMFAAAPPARRNAAQRGNRVGSSRGASLPPFSAVYASTRRRNEK